jgi:hypothetical protein
MNAQDINLANISLSVNNKKDVAAKENKKSVTDTVESSDIVETATIDNVLNKESVQYKKEPWCKLDKTTKILKLKEYVNNHLKNKYILNTTEVEKLTTYLVSCLDKVKLQRVKDVEYKKDVGNIINIPSLYFDKTTRKFTLKRCERRVNTLKSLSKPKKRKPADKAKPSDKANK